MIYLSPLALIVLWVFFLAYSALRSNWSELRIEVKVVGIVVVLIGFIIDVVVNWTLGLALGITPDLTLSQKCKRLQRANGWRREVAWYLCGNWLNPFDPGHC